MPLLLITLHNTTKQSFNIYTFHSQKILSHRHHHHENIFSQLISMAIHFLITPIFALFLISLFPFINSLSTIAISETGNQTVVCAISYSVNPNQQSLNCTIFPQRTQFPLSSPLTSVSGVVAGNGFICALSSFYPSSTSVMVCWRFSNFGNNLTYSRIYNGPLLRDLNSGNSHVCGLVNGSNSLQCWPWRDFNHTVNNNNISSSLAVGDNFVCGLSDSGRVQCFGIGGAYNLPGEMPVRIVSLLEAGFRHACAISLDGSLECWGTMLGQRPEGEFISLALAENRSCAIRRSNGTVICWGENGFGLPGSLRDEAFITLESKRTIFCGVVRSNISLVCWGNENFNLNPLAFDQVVPGPCTPRNECACDNHLPNYGAYCDQGLVICQPCDEQSSPANIPPPLPLPPPPPPPAAPPPPSGGGKRWNSVMVAVLVVGCFGSFSSLLVVCVFLFSRYIKIRGSRIHDSGRLEEGGSGSDRPNDPTDLPQPHPTPPVLEKKLSHLISMGSGGHLDEFPLEELLKATGNFSDEHKIGSGSFGSVYHATLDDGRRVAIKRAECSTSSLSYVGPTKRGEEDKDLAFMNELEFLSRLNHKNLVRLLGFCEDRNERVLVYEYMENGTLFDHLHKLEDSPLFSWATRITVALDAARGIEYLHEYSNPRIIHRDIKSSNILLDGAWTAKVSDFGLSLMGPRDEETHLSLRAAGTMGYMDPEYYRLQVLTTKSDVYSFGIVLLELLSGCKAIHKNVNGVPRNVVDYVVPYIVQDEVHRVLDRRVPPPTPFEIEAVAYVGYLAADCVALQGRDRPTMSEVVSSLDRALEACLAPQVLSRSTTSSTT